MSCDRCELTCEFIFECDRYNNRRDEMIDAIKKTIIDEELTPTVCKDSGTAEWSNGEAQALAAAIVKSIASLGAGEGEG